MKVEDEDILNMTKPLTVQCLNMMFSEKQDVFEFYQEREDWKFPKYVSILQTKKLRQQDINHYNDVNIT